MRNTKAYQVLSQLSIYERNRFLKFLESPYFNINRTVLNLYKSLETLLRDADAPEIEKEALWESIKEADDHALFEDVKLRKAYSDLLKRIQIFLAQQDFESHPYHYHNHLLSALAKHKLEPLYNSALTNARRTSQQLLERNSDYHHFQYILNKHQYNLTTEFKKKQAKSFDDLQENIEKILLNLDYFYFSEKLRYNSTVLSWKRFTTSEFSIQYMDFIIDQIKHMDKAHIPSSIAVYYEVMMTMLDAEDTSHYYNLKEYLNAYSDQFTQNEIRDIYDSAVSYCAQRVNKGEFEFQQEVFEMYKASLKDEALFVDGYMSPTTYRNIVFFALRVNEYDWAENFANSYVQRLKEPHRVNALNFSMARIKMYRKAYDEVISYLHQVDYEDFWYNINSRTILIAAYFELDEIDALENLLNSFKVYISRQKSMPESRRRNYLNLIKFTYALINIQPFETNKVQKLREDVEQNQMVNKPWIKQKIKERFG